jgi:hypothetical protein
MPTSAGRKVQNAADSSVTRENPGPVAPGSLAAESIRSGGEFSKNPAPSSESSSESTSTMTPSKSHPQSAPRQGAPAQGAPAPTYAQPNEPTGGPHGKNITEAPDGWDAGRVQDGTQLAMGAAVGSKDDPARLATLGMAAGRGAGAGGSAGAQGDGGAFDALKETSA